MAALLDVFDLRRHALPVELMAGLDREIDRRFTPGAIPDRRTHLAAAWHLGADGRPVCVWHAQFRAPDFPSG